MLEADMDLTSMAFGGKQAPGDETLLVKFYKAPIEDAIKSKEEGRPIFKEVDFIQIRQPGNKDSVIDRVARPRDIDRFPEHYRRYQARENQEIIEGTPLSETPLLTRAQTEELTFFGVRTVEQLATFSDANAHNIRNIQAMKSKAQAYLDHAKDNAAAQQLAEQKAENERLLELIKQLNDRLDEMEEEKPKRRGRPKKAAVAGQQE